MKGRPRTSRSLRVLPEELPDQGLHVGRNVRVLKGLLGVMDTIQEGAVTLAVNEAWLLMGGFTCLALVLLVMLGPIREPKPGVPLGQQAEF